MRRVLLPVLSAVMLIAMAGPGLASHSWNGYHWADAGGDDHSDGISLSLVSYLTEYASEYDEVLKDWNKGPLALDPTDGTDSSRPAACDNDPSDGAGTAILGTIHVCNKHYGENGWLGLARIWLSADGHIESAVSLMNDSYLIDDPYYNDVVAWQHVLCQEVGHTFGLDHQHGPKNQSCMNDMWGLKNADYMHPNAHDFDMLNEIYISTSGDGGGGGGGNTKPCNPNKPGCEGAAGARYAARPGGGTIVTYIIPAGNHSH